MPTMRERLREFPLLAEFDPDHLDLLTSAITPVSYVKRQRLFRQDDPAVGCWLLVAGRVAIDDLVVGHGHEVVATLGPGEIAGWSWPVAPYRWHFGAVALTSVDALLLDTVYLRRVMAVDTEFGQRMTEVMLRVAAQRAEQVEQRYVRRYRPDTSLRQAIRDTTG